MSKKITLTMVRRTSVINDFTYFVKFFSRLLLSRNEVKKVRLLIDGTVIHICNNSQIEKLKASYLRQLAAIVADSKENEESRTEAFLKHRALIQDDC